MCDANGNACHNISGATTATYQVRNSDTGNTLRVHPSQVGMFQETVQFNVVTVPGIQNMFFGGSGLFLAALTGPGRVWLQSMSMQHLAHAIQEYLPKASG